MNRLFIFFFFGLLLPISSIGQENTGVFYEEDLLWFIENYHPVSQQGEILVNKGESTLKRARGSFDPYLYANFDQKYFDSKEYYSILGTGLKIPTWYGIEVKTGFDQNSGLFLNPENVIPSDGLWYAGISVPIGQGLFIDERRATLKQAKLFADASIAEQTRLMNDLYFDAIKKYWKWVEAFNKYRIYEESVELAETRFNAVKRNYELGDKPAIDTLEAYIQVQNRQITRNELQLAYQNITLELSNYLWYENNTPLEITDSLRPPSFEEIRLRDVMNAETLEGFLYNLSEMHPELLLYQFKQAQLEIDNKLKAEALKPKLNLNYNFLSEQIGSDNWGTIPIQNYKWGLEFSFPILSRKQKGELELSQLKLQDNQLEQVQKLLILQNKVRSYFNEQLMLERQITLFNSTVNNYTQLLAGEKKKFTIGESSLFLVNSRENGVIDASLKLIELIAKYNVAQVGLVWSSGSLYERKEEN
jgi:outer membrane protein TolC